MNDYVIRDRAACYRYVSLLLTSILFLSKPGADWRSWVLPAIVVLFLAARWFTGMYKHMEGGSQGLFLLLTADLVGMLVILLLSGGIESPFIWYALSPVLTAVLLLPAVRSMALLAVCMAGGALAGFAADQLTEGRLVFVAADYWEVYTVWILLALVFLFFSEAHGELAGANAQLKETMDHIKSLYHMLETASEGQEFECRAYMTDGLQKLTKSDHAFIWEEGGGSNVMGERAGLSPDKQPILEFAKKQAAVLKLTDEPVVVKHPAGGDYMMAALRTSSKFIGIMGIRLPPFYKRKGNPWFAQQLSFLSDLYTVMVERQNVKHLERKLLIHEEQNRIADEMHDRVSQNLFSMVYCIHMLVHKWKNMTDSQIAEQLQLLKEASEGASRELRATIYSLSSKRQEEATWAASVKSHLKQLAMLNGVKVETRITGDDRVLSEEQQKILYRMMSESVGNAIRHGRSTSVRVELSITKSYAKLIVEDNGQGFDVRMQRSTPRKTQGLGLRNMEQLAYSLHGHFQVESRPGEGAKVFVILPAFAENDYQIGGESV